MNWLEISLQPTTLFSLKPSWATSSGGKSLLSPTPYALKMALLDVAIRTGGLEAGKNAWPWLRDLQVSIRLPNQIVVTNVFSRILRKRRGKSARGPFQKTIGYREYVHYPEPLTLTLGIEDVGNQNTLARWLPQINYLGKRGGFVQPLGSPVSRDNDDGFLRLTEEPTEIDPRGIVQQLDDCGHRMTFEHADIYSGKRVASGSSTGRIVRHIVLPFRLSKSSKSYTMYERIGEL
ncbi:MAG: hypothetical protein ACOCXI_08830 [Chloroflexota bacterium]